MAAKKKRVKVLPKFGNKRSLPGVRRTDAYAIDPDEFYLPELGHPRHDAVRFNLAVDVALAKNIAMLGVIDAVVCRTGTNPPEVVDGMQRVKAARYAKHQLGVVDLKVVFTRRRGTDEDLFGVMVSANRFRHEDGPAKLARDASQMLAHGASDKQVEVTFGWTGQQRRDHLKLLDLPADVRAAVDAGTMALSTAIRPGAEVALRKAGDARDNGGPVFDVDGPAPKKPRRVTARAVDEAAGRPPSAGPTRRQALRVTEHLFGLKLILKDEAQAHWFARGVEWALGKLSDDDVEASGLSLPDVGQVK